MGKEASMKDEGRQSEAGLGANWSVLDKWGIVALKKHEFNLDQYAAWLAIGCLDYNNFAKDPFKGNALPWSITSIVRMNIP